MPTLGNSVSPARSSATEPCQGKKSAVTVIHDHFVTPPAYSTYERGLDMLNVAYHYMDLVPKGRDEGDGGATTWARRRDEYQD